MNLGPSPQHARNVNLVLNLDTRLVSPQFHCRYNDFFETISFNKPEMMMSSNWQILTGLIRPDNTPTAKQIEDQGHPADYVGVNIKRLPDGSYKFSQQTLIDSIIADVGLTPQDFTKPVPAKCTLRLHAFLDLPPFQEEWNYRSAVGKLNYLGQIHHDQTFNR
ncbi:hypothetical protein ACHAW6_002012 [Cyclotella cf. meneghiniana]